MGYGYTSSLVGKWMQLNLISQCTTVQALLNTVLCLIHFNTDWTCIFDDSSLDLLVVCKFMTDFSQSCKELCTWLKYYINCSTTRITQNKIHNNYFRKRKFIVITFIIAMIILLLKDTKWDMEANKIWEKGYDILWYTFLFHVKQAYVNRRPLPYFTHLSNDHKCWSTLVLPVGLYIHTWPFSNTVSPSLTSLLAMDVINTAVCLPWCQEVIQSDWVWRL